MDSIDGKKTYLLAALYGIGFGLYQAGALGGAVDWAVFAEYLFVGGFAATFRSALDKLVGK